MANQSKIPRVDLTPDDEKSEKIENLLEKAEAAYIYLYAMAMDPRHTWETITSSEPIKEIHIHFILACAAIGTTILGSTNRVLDKHRVRIMGILVSKAWYCKWADLFVNSHKHDVQQEEKLKKREEMEKQLDSVSRAAKPVSYHCKHMRDTDAAKEEQLASSWSEYRAHVKEEESKLSEAQRQEKRENDRQELFIGFGNLGSWFYKVGKKSKRESRLAQILNKDIVENLGLDGYLKRD